MSSTPTTKLIAKKLTLSSEEYKPMELFLKGMGCTGDINLYSCGKLVYISPTILLHVLNITIENFKKVAKSPTHYLIINKELYISKYGLLLMIGQSTQPAAIKIQDYIYEVIYKLETKGSVTTDDVVSRQELNSVLTELSVSKEIEATHIATIEDLIQYKNESILTEAENKKLQSINNVLTENNAELVNENAKLIDLCKKLSKYVSRNSKAKKLIGSVNDIVTIDTENTSDDETTITAELKEAQEAKKELRTIKNKPLIINTNEYWILRSTQKYRNDEESTVYMYMIESTIDNKYDVPFTNAMTRHTYKNFQEFSADYRLGGIKTNVSFVIHSKVVIDIKLHAILKLVFSNKLSESFVTELLAICL